MNRVLVALIAAALIAPTVLADDLNPPWWDRDAPTATYQEWTFDGPPTGGNYYPEVEDNPYGQSRLYDPMYWEGDWLADYEGRSGVIHPWNYVETYIPNHDLENPDKFIWLQITWFGDGERPIPDVYLPGGDDNTVELEEEFALENGWMYSAWAIHIWPNPALEEIDLWPEGGTNYNMYIDQVVIDTICIPEAGPISWGDKSLLSSYPSFDNWCLRTRGERDTVGNLHFAVSLDEQSSPSSNFDRFVINPAGEVVETHLDWAGVGGRPVVTDPTGRNIYLRPVAAANEHGCVDSANYIHLFNALSGNISYAKLDPDGNTVIDWKTITSGAGAWNGYVQPVVTGDDMLVATWYRSTEDICAVMSTDGGETWSDIVVLVDRPADVQTTMLKTRVAADGCVHLVYRGYVSSPYAEWVYYTKLYPDWSTVCVGETVFRTSSTWYPFVSLDDAGDLHITFGPSYQNGTTLVYTRLRGDLDLGGAPATDETLTIIPDQTFLSGAEKVRYALNLPDENLRVHVIFEQGDYGLETNKDVYYIASWRPGDLDCDNDIDLDDFDIFAECLTGPDVAYPPDCDNADLDLDSDVDLADFALFQQKFTGP